MVRSANQPLLMIYPIIHPEHDGCTDTTPIVGFAASFPYSEQATEIEYVVNKIWSQQEIETLDGGDVDE